MRAEGGLEGLRGPGLEFDSSELRARRRLRHTGTTGEGRQELVNGVPGKLAVWRDVADVVALILQWRYGVTQVGRRVPERRVDEPPLSLTGPDGPAVPG